MAGLFSHSIGLPPIVAHGSDALQRRIVPDVLAGAKISALAVTEPGAGSDVARLACRARCDGGAWVIDGEKTFITSGLRADWITLAVRTGGPGAGGISLLAVPGDAPGLERTPLAKMGWWCSDTAQLRFANCRVPLDHLIGAEGEGFRAIMDNFNGERLLLAAGAAAFAGVCFDEALAWARQRRTFGEALVARHDRGETGPEWVAELCLLKNHATQAMQFCADQAVQILGGTGFVRGARRASGSTER